MQEGEQVLVVPARYINYDIFFDGWSDYNKIGQLHLPELLKQTFFMDRATAEKDETHKQLIPYCVIKNNNGQILTYQRTKKGGEQRLHAKWSIGYGGHCNPIDWDGQHVYWKCIERELAEEVGLLPHQYNSHLLGFIYDNKDEVGAVHYGIAHLISPSEQDFDLDKFHFEDTIGERKFIRPEDLEKEIDKFEGWSQILIRNKVLNG